MQQARQGQLEREALIKEIEKREVLVHCIVHDLANPLSGIVGALDLVGSEPISDGARRIVRMAQDACSRQQTLIQQILDVFSAEAHALEAVSLNPAQSPDLARTARTSLENGSISFQRRGVQSRLVLAPDEEALDWRVLGEVTRLDRVFANLLENALRHSPPGSTVDVRITRSEGDALVEIEDAGTGVPEEAVESLFRKLSKSKSGVRGKAGLGLYFCRITIERWGGAIGYRPGAGGGACFWFRLPLLLVNTSGNAASAL
jgi:signal transduction histidine kinase